MGSVNIRHAKPEELPVILEIDDRASQLYLDAGLSFDFCDDHPFVVAEAKRWERAINNDLAHIALSSKNQPIGFIVLGYLDGQPYLDQISVHPDHMRRGVGKTLMEKALSWSASHNLWLTTYSHLPWNKAYYQQFGFVEVSEQHCDPQMKLTLQAQRLALPDPDKRIAMVRSGQNKVERVHP